MTLPLALFGARLRLHLDASDSETITTDPSCRIATWVDKSLSRHVFAPVAGYGKPLRLNNSVFFDPTGFNPNLPANSCVLQSPASTALNVRPLTVFAVLSDVENGSAPGPVVASTVGSTINPVTYDFVSHEGAYWRRDFGTTYVARNLVGWGSGVGRIVEGKFTETETGFEVDGGLATPTQGSSARSGLVALLGASRLCSVDYPANQLKGSVREIIAVEAISEHEREYVKAYLKWKWADVFNPEHQIISGRVVDLVGVGTPRVVLFDWDDPKLSVAPVVQQTGVWTYPANPNGRIGIYYISRDSKNHPVIHGPYTQDDLQ